VSRADIADVDNLGAWLTTVLARVCLNALRSRAQRKEESLDFVMPDPILDRDGGDNPEQQALLADSVGIALLVVLETLTPVERLAFVLHDLFAVPFDEIGGMIDRSPDAARQLASRARRRVRGRAPVPDPDIARQREVVDAFFAAARNGSFEALIAILHPDVVFRAEGLGPVPFVLTGAETVARNARMFGPSSPLFRPVLVNGGAGVVLIEDGQLKSITGFTVVGARIVAIDVLADPERLSAYDLSVLD
jgi:RNA polymerase sigma-70 factor (ECF subfamily)